MFVLSFEEDWGRSIRLEYGTIILVAILPGISAMLLLQARKTITRRHLYSNNGLLLKKVLDSSIVHEVLVRKESSRVSKNRSIVGSPKELQMN